MLTFYCINVCYYVYIFWSHFSKPILTTEEVIKKLSTNVILATNKLVSATENVSISRYKVILATDEVITAT